MLNRIGENSQIKLISEMHENSFPCMILHSCILSTSSDTLSVWTGWRTRHCAKMVHIIVSFVFIMIYTYLLLSRKTILNTPAQVDYSRKIVMICLQMSGFFTAHPSTRRRKCHFSISQAEEFLHGFMNITGAQHHETILRLYICYLGLI